MRATESHICSLPNIESKTEVPASSDTLLTSRGAPVGAALSHGIAFAVATGNVRFAARSPDGLRTAGRQRKFLRVDWRLMEH